MNQFLGCDWLPERARWGYLARSGLPAVKPYNINASLTKFVQLKWPDIASLFFCEFMDLGSVSVHKHAKKELGQYPAILFFNANESTKDIPPSWLHTWSITHTSQPRFSRVGSPYASTPIFNLRVWRFFATYDLWSNTGGTTWVWLRRH